MEFIGEKLYIEFDALPINIKSQKKTLFQCDKIYKSSNLYNYVRNIHYLHHCTMEWRSLNTEVFTELNLPKSCLILKRQYWCKSIKTEVLVVYMQYSMNCRDIQLQRDYQVSFWLLWKFYLQRRYYMLYSCRMSCTYTQTRRRQCFYLFHIAIERIVLTQELRIHLF